jgi:opacity protein-like surface antigen
MKSILRSLAVLAVVVGFTGSAFAQDANNDIIRPITKQGSAAFMFTLGGLGTFNLAAPTLGPGLGSAGFGMKYFLADDVALRVLLGLSMNGTTTPGTGSASDVTSSNNGFGLGVGVEYHFRPLYSTSPYIGGQIGFASNSTDNGLDDNAGGVQTSTTNLSIAALAGFNWFFTRGIAVGGEYSLGFTSTSGTTTTAGTENDNASTSMIGFGGVGSVHFIVYF